MKKQNLTSTTTRTDGGSGPKMDFGRSDRRKLSTDQWSVFKQFLDARALIKAGAPLPDGWDWREITTTAVNALKHLPRRRHAAGGSLLTLDKTGTIYVTPHACKARTTAPALMKDRDWNAVA